MDILDEKELRRIGGRELSALIDCWHGCFGPHGGNVFSVCVGNRRDSGSPLRGGVLTEAVLTYHEKKACMMIWYDPMEIYYDRRVAESGYSREVIDEISEMLREGREPGADCDPVRNPGLMDKGKLAVQIGIWTLRMRGFRKLHNENRKFAELETFINFEARIPALYGLFSEAGFDYSEVERRRLRDFIEGLRMMDEPARRVDRALNALRLQNLLSCSGDPELKKELAALAEEKFPVTVDYSRRISQLRDRFPVEDPDGEAEFLRELVVDFRMPGNWTELDEMRGLVR